MELEKIPQQVTDILGPVSKMGAVVELVRFNDRSNPPTLQVTIDRIAGTESLNLDEIGDISRLIGDLLDEADEFDSEYTLEVSTPGAESPLTRRRHYERNIGRTVQVKTVDGDKFQGVLEAAGATAFTLATDTGVRTIDYSDVKRARPRVQFS